jgi:hypothetical protein
MEKDKVEQRYRLGKIRVAEIRKPLLVKDRIHPCYEIEERSASRTETDRFEIFAIVPKDGDPALPSFVARWDEPEMTVDVDMHYQNKVEKKFNGHHTERHNLGEALPFPIRVELPNGKFLQLTDRIIFEGSINLAELSLRLYAESSVEITETAIATSTPPTIDKA